MSKFLNHLKKQRAKKLVREPASIPDVNQLEMFEIEAVKKASRKEDNFLEAANTVTIRETPYQPLGTFAINRSDVVSDGYLLIGMDTEYQPEKPVFTNKEVEAGSARYEVLSYQFHAIQLDGSWWEGIAIPNPNQRLTLTEFLTYALAAGAERGQVIPEKIVLVGHYNRADIPAFADRGQVMGRVKNVRNSLVTQAVPMIVKMRFGEEIEPVEFKVYLRDTMLLAPAGRKSLAALGELVNIPKMMLHETKEGDLRLKRRMKYVRDNNWELFREYALLDAKISALYFQQVTGIYQMATAANFVPSLLSTIGVKLLQAEWRDRVPVVDPIQLIGREAHKEVLWNDKTATFVTKSYQPYVEEVHWWAEFATECYHGGRNEQLWFGPTFEDDWSDYDLKSAYPTAMATIGRPDWRNIYHTDDVSQFTLETFGFACVDFKFPDDTRYPTLPVRSDNGLIFPLSGRSYCAAPEIQLALHLGCAIRIRLGVIIPQNLEDRMFFPFIKDSIKRRKAAPSPIENEFWKEVTNSCYGKTAQGLRRRRVFDMRTEKTERIGPSAITNPFCAAYITSFVRAAVGEVMNAIPTDKMVFSVTTDGLNTNATDADMTFAKQGPIMSLYAETVTGLTGSDEVLTEKHSVKQLLGWQTRGQATIEPGDGPELGTRYVLAKGGVRTPIEYREVDEQNEYMLNLFFGRTPKTMIDIEVHTTMADMIKHGADLVSKKSSKRASMEYDFKRCPAAATMANVQLPGGTNIEHIVFSTKPWRDIAEFKMVRSMWSNYRRSGEGVCLKTIRDYADFAKHFEMMKSLPNGKDKYFRKDDKGGLQRLRRDLCRAYKHGEAGFSKVERYSAAEFASILNSSMVKFGVETKVSDVENGKRAAFKPNCTPPTNEVEAVIRELQVYLPELDATVLLGSVAPNDVLLSPALTAECPFVMRLKGRRGPVGP